MPNVGYYVSTLVQSSWEKYCYHSLLIQCLLIICVEYWKFYFAWLRGECCPISGSVPFAGNMFWRQVTWLSRWPVRSLNYSLTFRAPCQVWRSVSSFCPSSPSIFPFRNFLIYILFSQRRKDFCHFHFPDYHDFKFFMVSGFQGH